MATCYIGEIRLLANNFAPRRWSQCLGQTTSIAQNQALYSLLGITYGGDGRTSFGLPNLIGRVPIAFGTGPGLPPYRWGELDGEAEHYITTDEMPSHKHTSYTRFTSDINDVTDTPTGSYLSRLGEAGQSRLFYKTPPGSGQLQLADEAVAAAGATEAHENRQPFICINYYIALDGIYPPRS